MPPYWPVLTIQELVALDFHFEQPIWGEAPVGKGAAAEVPAEEIDDYSMAVQIFLAFLVHTLAEGRPIRTPG